MFERLGVQFGQAQLAPSAQQKAAAQARLVTMVLGGAEADGDDGAIASLVEEHRQAKLRAEVDAAIESAAGAVELGAEEARALSERALAQVQGGKRPSDAVDAEVAAWRASKVELLAEVRQQLGEGVDAQERAFALSQAQGCG